MISGKGAHMYKGVCMGGGGGGGCYADFYLTFLKYPMKMK